MPQLAPHIDSVPGSGIRAILEVALTLDDTIMLAVGEPDIPLASHIAGAARAAWDADATNYGPNGGIPLLRSTIVEKLAAVNDIHVPTEQVWVTVGGTQALHQSMVLTLSAGDEVLIPDPGYTTFTMSARMLDAQPVTYSLLPENSFLPDIEQLETIVTDRTRAIIVNSPSNPLGVVFDRETLQGVLDFAKRHDLWVISDEVYEAFTYGEPHVSIASLDTENRVFSVFSLSKTYAMTGVRVGYLVTPPGLADTMRTVQEATISCVATPDQFAAVAAIAGDQSHVGRAAKHYRDNFEVAREVLERRGIEHYVPQGSFYLWIDVSHVSDGDVATWARRFMLEQRVAVAPGSAFGRSGEGWIRVCLAATPDDIRTGLGRIPARD